MHRKKKKSQRKHVTQTKIHSKSRPTKSKISRDLCTALCAFHVTVHIPNHNLQLLYLEILV